MLCDWKISSRGVRPLGCATSRLSAPRAEAARVRRVPRVCVDGVPRGYEAAINCGHPGRRVADGGRVATCYDRGGTVGVTR